MARRVKSNTTRSRQIELGKLRTDAIIIDQYGHVWQHGGIYWYRAFDSEKPESTWELAQFAGEYRVIEEGRS